MYIYMYNRYYLSVRIVEVKKNRNIPAKTPAMYTAPILRLPCTISRGSPTTTCTPRLNSKCNHLKHEKKKKLITWEKKKIKYIQVWKYNEKELHGKRRKQWHTYTWRMLNTNWCSHFYNDYKCIYIHIYIYTWNTNGFVRLCYICVCPFFHASRHNVTYNIYQNVYHDVSQNLRWCCSLGKVPFKLYTWVKCNQRQLESAFALSRMSRQRGRRKLKGHSLYLTNVLSLCIQVNL